MNPAKGLGVMSILLITKKDMNEKEYLQQELNEWYNIQSTLLNFLSRCSDETTAFVRGALEELAESLETE